jgi:hypothetical protein
MAIGIAVTQLALSLAVILISSFTIPLYGFDIISLNAMATVVTPAKIALSFGIILVGSFMKPF